MRLAIVYVRPRIYATLGKLACPRVNDDQKIDVDDQKLNSGRPHDYWILENLFYKMLFIISIFDSDVAKELLWFDATAQ